VALTFDSATARDASLPMPNLGQDVILLDTGALEIWYGPPYGWLPPWNQPYGLVGYATNMVAHDVGAYGGWARYLTDLAVPMTAVKNRVYRVEFWANVDSGANGDIVQVGVGWVDDGSPLSDDALNASAASRPTFTETVVVGLEAISPTRLYGTRLFSSVVAFNEADSGATLPANTAGEFFLGATQVGGTGGVINDDSHVYITDVGPAGPPN
jgi:hypothetical protein